jgi:hypothetical protein
MPVRVKIGQEAPEPVATPAPEPPQIIQEPEVDPVTVDEPEAETPLPTDTPVSEPDMVPDPSLDAPPTSAQAAPSSSPSVSAEWRADWSEPDGPALIGELAETLDCADGFAADCAAVRKDVFAAQQLSDSDKAWMPTRANSGLSDPRFKGMSEAQIMRELGVAVAGENGINVMVVTISSMWVDPFLGVNKGCRLGTHTRQGEAVGAHGLMRCAATQKAQGDLPSWRREDWQPGGVTPDPAEWIKKKKPGE